MLTGVGNLNFCINTSEIGIVHLPPCVATFMFKMNAVPRDVNYLGSDNIVKTREAGIYEETYQLTVTVEDIDFSHLQLAYGELAPFLTGQEEAETIDVCPLLATTYVDARITTAEKTWVYNPTERIIMKKVEATPAEKNEYFVDFTNNQIEFHPDNVGEALTIALVNVDLTRGVIGSVNSFIDASNLSFQGDFFGTNNDTPYTLVIDNLERINNPTYASDGRGMTIDFVAVRSTDVENERKPFRIYAEGTTAGEQIGQGEITAEFFFADFPTQFPPCVGSVLTLAGFAVLTNNPDALDIETVAFTSVFDFATPGTETINFMTNAMGGFSFNYDVDDLLGYPQNGFLTITLDATGDISFQQAVETTPPPTFPFTANLNGGNIEFSQITISGTGLPGSVVTLSSTNLGGLFDGAMVDITVSGSWAISGFLPASVGPGTTYTVTASVPEPDDDVVMMNTVLVQNFAPFVSHSSPVATGRQASLQNTATARAFRTFEITIESPDLIFVLDDEVTPDGTGSWNYQYTIPFSEQGKLITYTFVEQGTLTTVVDTFTAPQYDGTMVFALDAGQGLLYGGQDSLTGTLGLSVNYNAGITLKDGGGNTVGSANISFASGTGSPDAFNISIPVTFDPVGDWSIEAVAEFHTTEIIDPITAGIATFLEGFTAQLAPGLYYPGGSMTFSGLAPKGDTVNLTVFSTPYMTTASAVDNTWQIVVPISGGQATGMYTATVSTPNVPGNEMIDFDVDQPSMTLTSGCPGPALISGSAGPFASFSGEILPTKTITATWVGVPIPPDIINPDIFGTWSYNPSLSWQPSGTWQVTFTATGEADIVCSGTHVGGLDAIPQSLSLEQGSTGNSMLLRGPENSTLDVVVDGPLATTASLATNAVGFATLLLDDVPLLTQAPDSGSINFSEATSGQADIAGYSINVRVPITVNIGSPSALAAGGQPVLWTNSSFLVTGATPTNGVYGLTAIGSSDSFTLLSAVADTYQANFMTNNDGGTATLTVSTIFQDPGEETFIVSPPTTFDIPDSFIINTVYDLVIFVEQGTLSEIQVIHPTEGTVLLETAEATVLNEHRVSFDTTGLPDGVELSIILKTEWFTFETQMRQLDGLSSGIPSIVRLNTSADKTLGNCYTDMQITNPVFGTDNQPINEAGAPADLTSDFALKWIAPANTFEFRSYLIEQYSSPVTGWAFFDDITDPEIVITDLDSNYRVTAQFGGMVQSKPVYLGLPDNILFAKNFIGINTGADIDNSQGIVTPEGAIFFTFSSLRTGDESSVPINVGRDRTIDPGIVTPEGSIFFTFTTVRTGDESSLLINVGRDRTIDPGIVTPEDTPFFSI